MLLPNTHLSSYSFKARSHKCKLGCGILNNFIENLSNRGIELHYPSYNYLGPGTRLVEKLLYNIAPINPLDAAAKEHDISYSRFKDLSNRHIADKILENKAWGRVTSRDASLGERAAVWLTTNAMKIKRKLGMGVRRRGKPIKKRPVHKGSGLTFRQLISKSKKAIKAHPTTPTHGPLETTFTALRKHKLKKGVPRVIPVPKSGGFIPIVPVLSALFR